MLLFIVLDLLVTLTKSLIVATEAGFKFAAVVAIAGLFSCIWRPDRTSDKSFDLPRPSASAAEGHFETTDHLQQAIAANPAERPRAESSLVRRLVRAKDDPAKQRIRAQLSGLDDERLFCLGLTSGDIAALRGTADLPAEVTIASVISPPIAAPLDATDDVPRHESERYAAARARMPHAG